MKALVIAGPGRAAVQELPEPEPAPGEVVVAVRRAGICGTDLEFFTGEMAYLHSGDAHYPIRIGHEWMGVVESVGDGVDPAWRGRRVTGDTMLGCGACHRCRTGRQHVCAHRLEVGIRGGKDGALAERLAVPASSLISLPDEVDDIAGALIEPGGNAFRSVDAAQLSAGDSCLVIGAGTIGVLCAAFARGRGADVHLLARSERSIAFARSLGFAAVREPELPDVAWDAVIDASNDAAMPARAVQLVDAGKRVVFVGLSGTPSLVDTRDLALKDVTAVGVLSASPGLTGARDAYAAGDVDPRPLVAATVGLDELPGILAGERPDHAGPGPKFHVAL